MLKELRQALADQLSGTLSGVALVVPYKPGFMEWPTQSPVIVFLRPDPSDYVSAWRTFSQTGQATVTIEVVVTIPYTDNAADPGLDYAALDDIIDPISDATSIFAALIDTTTGSGVVLSLDSGHTAVVNAMLAPVGGASLVQDAEGALVRYEIAVPVQVIVKRS